jgi:hypothetical protein
MLDSEVLDKENTDVSTGTDEGEIYIIGGGNGGGGGRSKEVAINE